MSIETRRAERRARLGALEPAEAAWAAALPCALLTVAAVVLLGPPLGRALLGPGREAFWPGGIAVRPEPVEHGRYVVALLGPAALAAAVSTSARWGPIAALRGWAVAGRAGLVAFVLACLAAQNGVLLHPAHTEGVVYFTLPTLLLALALPALGLAAARRDAIAARVARLVRETPARTAAAWAIAIAFTAAWLLSAVETDGSLSDRLYQVISNLPTAMDEPFAILDGRTPLVDFHAQYGQLWPYATAGAMSLLGSSVAVFTIANVTGSAGALLAVFALLRRVTRSAPLALALYLPFVATGFFKMLGPDDNRYGPANLFGLWPIRYGGPYVLAWLLGRHLGGVAPRRVWPLFLAAGIVALNNPEFGCAALIALAAALLVTCPPRTRRATARLLAEAGGGLLGATALVTLLTLARTGGPPRFGLALEFSRLFGREGFAMLPMPPIGLDLALYATFAGAIAVAAVRAARREPDAVLTGALAWSGTFGLLAGAYFVGRSYAQVLIALFSIWALALALLTVAAGRVLAARRWRRPEAGAVLVLFGFGLAVCSLAQTPLPWVELSRLTRATSAHVVGQLEAEQLVRATTRPGEKVAILTPLGHRVAYDTGRVDVAPYAGIESMPAVDQLTRTIAVLRREGGRAVFVSTHFTLPEQLSALEHAGFRPRLQIADSYVGGAIMELVDGVGGR